MSSYAPADEAFESRVRDSFARQLVMHTLGARLARIDVGEVDVELPFRQDLTQQHGFLHAGVITIVVDSACGYAAYTLMPPDAAVLSVEFKINLLAPAAGDLLLARGKVVRRGRTITVCSGEAAMREGTDERIVATMLATMMAIRGRGDLAG